MADTSGYPMIQDDQNSTIRASTCAAELRQFGW
jgi:hypothetical protein